MVEAIKRALKEKKAYEPSVGLYPGVDLNFSANIFYKTSEISKEHDLIFKGEEDMVRHIEVETLRLSVRNENINIIKLISELIRKLKTFILLVALYPYVNMERAELCFIYACDKCLSEIGIRGILKETMPFSIEELEKKAYGTPFGEREKEYIYQLEVLNGIFLTYEISVKIYMCQEYEEHIENIE